jgi:hypothetical protein
MGQHNQQATAADAAASAIEGAMNAMNAASHQMQALAGECFEMSKQSFEHASQTLEKLRKARGMEEIMEIQANYVKEAFDSAAQHARKFGELMAVFPNEFTKTYQDAWLKAVDTAVQTMHKAGPPGANSGSSAGDNA